MRKFLYDIIKEKQLNLLDDNIVKIMEEKKKDKYRYINSLDEIKPGLKCQSCFFYFEDPKNTYTEDSWSGFKEKWYDVEFTDKLYKETISLINHDSHEVEFRIAL